MTFQNDPQRPVPVEELDPRIIGGYGQVVPGPERLVVGPVTGPVPAVNHVASEKPVKQARDRAQYVRNQKGHSLTLHILFGGFVLWIPLFYYSLSPNHYWHA